MKIVSWNIGKYDGKKGTIEKERSIKSKLKVLEDLLKHEDPDIFCLIEGTIAKGNLQIQQLFQSKNYFTYYEPAFVHDPQYQGLFDFTFFETFGLKVFVKNSLKSQILPFVPSRAVHKGRLINLELSNNEGTFIFLHRNMSTKDIDQHSFFKVIHEWCFIGKLGAIAKNLYLIGDFNLTPWDSKYFTERSGYIVSEFVESLYEIRSRSSVCFFNPIINHLASVNKKNLGGTFYSDNHGWGTYDFALIRDFDSSKQILEIITDTPKYQILDTIDLEREDNFINYNFDHLPIKLTLI